MNPTPIILRRNDPCHCGGGKKYKRCHLDADVEHGRQVSTEQAKAAARVVSARLMMDHFDEILGEGTIATQEWQNDPASDHALLEEYRNKVCQNARQLDHELSMLGASEVEAGAEMMRYIIEHGIFTQEQAIRFAAYVTRQPNRHEIRAARAQCP